MNKIYRAVSALLLIGIAGTAAADPTQFNFAGTLIGGGTFAGDVIANSNDQGSRYFGYLPGFTLTITGAANTALDGTFNQTESNYSNALVALNWPSEFADQLDVTARGIGTSNDSEQLQIFTYDTVPAGGSAAIATGPYYSGQGQLLDSSYVDGGALLVAAGTLTEGPVGFAVPGGSAAASSSVPAPASLGLMGLGLLAAFRRRRS